MSEVVDTVRLAVCGLVGLVTPSSWMLTASPAAIVLAPVTLQVATATVVDDEKQFPTALPLVVSVTVELKSLLKLVSAGSVIVIWLLAAAESPPVAEVLNATV